LFYILEHYDTACTNQKSAEEKSQKSTAEIAKIRNMMQTFVTQTATNTSGSNNADFDCDRDQELDCPANASMQ